MKNFDEDRALREQQERKITIGGRELRFRAGIEPERFAEYVDFVSGALEPSPKELEAVAILDRTIEAYLEPGSREAWRELRADVDLDNPITSKDMHAVIGHMVEVQNVRPSEPSGNSGTGDAQTGIGSTDGSRSLAAVT